eukprot:3930790-Rhodomonas_salina.1
MCTYVHRTVLRCNPRTAKASLCTHVHAVSPESITYVSRLAAVSSLDFRTSCVSSGVRYAGRFVPGDVIPTRSTPAFTIVGKTVRKRLSKASGSS